VWRVFYAKPRAEKRAAARLAGAGHEVFLPLRAALRQWSDRKQRVEEPLFPGYLFARVDERARLDVLQDEAVVRCVGFGGALAAVPEAEIAAMKALQAVPERLAAVTQRAFPVGAEVYVARGPVQGVRGRVLAHPKTCYLLVEVPSVRQAIRVHVPADWVLRPVAEMPA
jgi:transcription antitermination factor NusG